MHDLKEIGARLRVFYKQHVGSQADLARETDQNVKTINLMVNGHVMVNNETITVLAQKYNLDPDWLLTGKGEVLNNQKPNPKSIANLHAKVAKLELELKSVKGILEQVLAKLS
ncbi:helix-turn-helix domain-containing protein [Pedobacter gandavensis]|uniref:HTH cro/C1-type domain-containing protein n=1 Tax=Pedobacter gandavensis TaxID=2679963 RepID=A0ABR6EUW8_9SPHI|nr:helix-turn-helix transcriptional regulator [Pedobacter gandavensis]MBB2148842.1 hypothetical protein [Pedobacter gandavensis]